MSHNRKYLAQEAPVPPHVLEPRICITTPSWKWRILRPISPRSEDILSAIGPRELIYLFWLFWSRGRTNRLSVFQLDRSLIPVLCTIKSWQDMVLKLMFFSSYYLLFTILLFLTCSPFHLMI
jgi:hypothetical protein